MFKWILACAAFAMPAVASDWENLWPGDAPGAPRPPAGSEKVENDRLSHIEVPQFQVYLPEKETATGAAVVILPGGGYTILAAGHEGRGYAEWLAERGIAGIVVKYRVSGDDAFGYRWPVPYLDARRAIRTVRAKAGEWNIDPAKVGVMGSSAGGHLASVCATRFEDRFEEETSDAIDGESCRPEFAILVYPVISMEKPITHEGSQRRLLGAEPAGEMVESLSTERAVTPETPPVFLLSTSDDFVDCRNSLQFAAACKAAQVPVTLHLFEAGGHGYGLGGKGAVEIWPDLLDRWLRDRSLAR